MSCCNSKTFGQRELRQGKASEILSGFFTKSS